MNKKQLAFSIFMIELVVFLICIAFDITIPIVNWFESFLLVHYVFGLAAFATIVLVLVGYGIKGIYDWLGNNKEKISFQMEEIEK